MALPTHGLAPRQARREVELHVDLPTPALRACLAAAVAAALPGSSGLDACEREVLDAFCLRGRLTARATALLDASEAGEASLPQPAKSGDPLKSKFTQYSRFISASSLC